MVSHLINSFKFSTNFHNYQFFSDTSPAANRMPAYVPGSKGYIENGRSIRDNPHKYLLYKPTLSQLMVFLSSGFKGEISFFQYSKISEINTKFI